MNRALAHIFLGSSLRSITSSGLNLLTTVLLARWFGAEIYSHYIVDLAMISLLLIVLEVVPSNYSVFRVQDDPIWLRSIAAQIAVTVLIAACVVFVAGHWGGFFQAYTFLMALYASTVAIKRYLDIRLQSSGRLGEFMGIELSTSAIRLLILIYCYLVETDANIAVWASLAISSLLSLVIWWARNPEEIKAFSGCTDQKAWRALAENFPAYVPYYYGIVLKRLKDNLVPLAAERLFASRELLAAFLLAYRGVNFAVGQVRLLESMMNHRGSLAIAQRMSRQHRYIVATIVQILCLGASTGLLLSSGMHNLPWLPTFALSFMVWPIVFFVLERAKAYSSFQANKINTSILSYLGIVFIGTFALKLFDTASVTIFSWLLVAAEATAFIVLNTMNEVRHASKN